MGQKVNPIIQRLSYNKKWSSKWFNIINYAQLLKEDFEINQFLINWFNQHKIYIKNIYIKRNNYNIIIYIQYYTYKKK